MRQEQRKSECSEAFFGKKIAEQKMQKETVDLWSLERVLLSKEVTFCNVSA